MTTKRSLSPVPLCLALLLGLGSWLPGPAFSQLRLDRPAAAFPEDFGSIQTVRELPDGRVLVADPLSKVLYVVDMAAGRRTAIGREGQGPGEFRQPDAVWALPGDSTLLVDLGNGRLTALGPDLSFGPTTPIMVGDFQPGSPPVMAIPQGVDGRGRVYARAMPGGMGGPLPDSAGILRIDRGSRTSARVATFKTPSMTQAVTGGANNQNVRISPVPLSPEDAWGVAPDGSVVIARSADYHLERIAPDGTVARGQAVSFEPVRIGTAEKEEYLAEQGRSGGGISVGMENRNGVASATFSRGSANLARDIAQYTWPERKPPFFGGRIPIDPQGRAWVRRHVNAGEASTYDVFDAAGRRVGTVLLANGKRVVGFGRDAVYVVAFDAFDLNFLERHAMPAF